MQPRPAPADPHRGSAIDGSASRAENILGSIADALFALDPAWRFSYVNAHAERLLDRPAGELLGRCVWDVFPDQVGSTFDLGFREVAATGCPLSFVAQSTRLGAWFSVHARPYADGVLVGLHDVSELKAAERRTAQLADGRERLRRVATAVAADRRTDEVLALVRTEAAGLAGGDLCWVVRFTGEDLYTVVAGTDGHVGDFRVGALLDLLPGSALEHVARTGSPV